MRTAAKKILSVADFNYLMCDRTKIYRKKIVLPTKWKREIAWLDKANVFGKGKNKFVSVMKNKRRQEILWYLHLRVLLLGDCFVKWRHGRNEDSGSWGRKIILGLLDFHAGGINSLLINWRRVYSMSSSARLIIVVWLKVYLEVTLLCEEFLADIAFEGLHTEMLSQVDLETRFLRIWDRTQVAPVGLNIAVIHQMGLQMTFGNERVVASGMHALIWTVISL